MCEVFVVHAWAGAGRGPCHYLNLCQVVDMEGILGGSSGRPASASMTSRINATTEADWNQSKFHAPGRVNVSLCKLPGQLGAYMLHVCK